MPSYAGREVMNSQLQSGTVWALPEVKNAGSGPKKTPNHKPNITGLFKKNSQALKLLH